VTILLLIRHALTDFTGKRLSGSTPGIHLSAEGKAQAEHLAERVSTLPISALYTSPLERCMETALAIGARRALTVRALPELEEVGYGRWTGRPLAQLARTALWKKVQHSPSSVRFPGGETLGEVQRRAVTALDGIVERHPRATVAAVTHADVIRLTLAHYAGVHIDLFQRLIVSPSSVSAVVLGDRIPRILRINDTGTVSDLAARTRKASPGRASSAPRGGS